MDKAQPSRGQAIMVEPVNEYTDTRWTSVEPKQNMKHSTNQRATAKQDNKGPIKYTTHPKTQKQSREPIKSSHDERQTANEWDKTREQ